MQNAKNIENVSKECERKSTQMRITKEQAKYWYSVAKKDIADGHKEAAWNIYRWFKENNAWFHAKQLQNALSKTT